ncbi:hypothetical protein CEUSTIGMA_g297.t1 [Chlamydomonas eustigma]|uniref:Uncharacterized protein n=1 Tax=Chlamydomonas eustigma TaxID=1157962 RepID=A0A250WQA0_9CHLO|nr:hypothetical protein CEUSTIGMA_g297.t1 [Chlamydomonas eustigma]|eukprot:GAX72842.1 hypothetical protein CEUSTIGMA_g297.t1 [Chlamydomonas eustigma]
MAKSPNMQRWLVQATYHELKASKQYSLKSHTARVSHNGGSPYSSGLKFVFACLCLVVFTTFMCGRSGYSHLDQDKASRLLPSMDLAIATIQDDAATSRRHLTVSVEARSAHLNSQRPRTSAVPASLPTLSALSTDSHLVERGIDSLSQNSDLVKPADVLKPPNSITDLVKASRPSWQTLTLLIELPEGTRKSQNGREHIGGTISTQLLHSENSISTPEAFAVLDLLLSKILDSNAPMPYELQQPEAKTLLGLIYKIWNAHRSGEVEGVSLLESEPHCDSTEGQELLRAAGAAAAALQQASCVGSDMLHPGTGLPYVLLRRATTALFHLIHNMVAEKKLSCSPIIAEVLPTILKSFAGAQNCSRSARKAFELVHISKSGGTSMCQLASDSKLYNPGTNVDANCLVPHLYDEPKWTRLQPGQDAQRIWPAVSCPNWPHSPQVDCKARAEILTKEKITFLSNEVGLHEGTEVAGSAKACPQLETVIVLRDSNERAQSHVGEVMKVFTRFRAYGSSYGMAHDLEKWKTTAPAIIDNYMIRSLLGRHFMHCRDFGTLGEPELLAASLALSSIDHVLVLGQDDLNDVVMKAGMGWSSGLRSKRWRWSGKNIESDLGFPSGSMAKLQQWNQLDRLIHAWGKSLLKLDAAFHAEVAGMSGHLVAALVEEDIHAASAPLNLPSSNSAARRGTTTAAASAGVKLHHSSGYVHVDDNRKLPVSEGPIVPSGLLSLNMVTLINNSSDVIALVSNLTRNNTSANSHEISVLLIKLPIYRGIPISPKWHAKADSSVSVSVHSSYKEFRTLTRGLTQGKISQNAKQASVIHAALLKQQKELRSREALVARHAKHFAALQNKRGK